MQRTVLIGLILGLTAHAFPHSSGRDCPPFKGGTFVIDKYQLYAENADWDAHSCLVYFGLVPNHIQPGSPAKSILP